MTMSVKGLRELDRTLSALPSKIENKVLRQGLGKAAKYGKRRLQAATPKRSGLARRKIKRRARASRSRGAYAVVKFDSPVHRYMHIYEHGATKSGRQRARPFFRQAISGIEVIARREIADGLKAAIERGEG